MAWSLQREDAVQGTLPYLVTGCKDIKHNISTSKDMWKKMKTQKYIYLTIF
jgi:hypothetical protein